MVVSGVQDVGWDEFAVIRIAGGADRHGLVLDVDGDLAVVEVLEGTQGMSSQSTSVSFDGHPLEISVGTSWLGRVCDGRGQPRDGGPPIVGRRQVPVEGRPLNPTMRQPPSDP
ncbi:MAG TPA: hypothetical protein VN683_12175, partial [Acidothermaceae bacterium]|nr:hypothetical protein [Acidothermaceae bacterium]